MKFAGVYGRLDDVFVYSMHQILSGAHIDQDDAVALNASDLQGIGAAVRTALAAYREDMPTPPPETLVRNEFKSLYALAGVQTARAFFKGARSVSVKWHDGHITLTPWKNEGAWDNFVTIDGHDHIIADTASNSNLGAKVIAALADAE